MEYQASLVEAVAFSRVLVKVQNGNFLELNIIKWINEVKSRGSTDSDGPTRTKTSVFVPASTRGDFCSPHLRTESVRRMHMLF